MFYLEFTKLPPFSTKQVGFRVAAIHEKAENEDSPKKAQGRKPHCKRCSSTARYTSQASEV